VGVLIEAVEAAGLKDSTTFIVTADHGFHSVEWEMNIRPAFEKAGLADKLQFGGSGWSASLVRKETFDRNADQKKLDAVLAELEKHPRINRVVRPEDMHALGQPRWEESSFAAGEYLILPDIDTYLATKPGGSMERTRRASPAHGHGYLPTHPRMHPSLLLSGADVRKGALIGHVRNHDIAPTVARLLGLEMPKMSGRVLEEALE
jgi:arylsulfatase A-like enzyme